MKGIFTQIKYRAQGVTLQEAKLTGMVVGIPIATEHKKQISLESKDDDLIPGSAAAQPIITINGLNPAFDIVTGDVLYGAGFRMWIRKSSETMDDIVELKLDGSNLTIANKYNTEEALTTANPVKNRTIPDGTTATYNTSSGEITFSNVITDLASGDTISGTDATAEPVARIGKIGTPRTVGITTVAPVTWNTEDAANGLISAFKLYYDYTADPYSGADRGYVMYFDSLVYRTSVYGVKLISSVDDISDLFGNNSLENPLSNLACGAFLYMGANGNKDKFKICALDLRDYDGLASAAPSAIMSSAALWMSAQGKVDLHKDVYFLTTMTDNETVQSSWEQYVYTSSSMERRREKRYWMARAIINAGDITASGIAEKFGNALYNDTSYEAGNKYEDEYGTDDVFDKDADVEAAQAVPMATNSERITYIGCEYATMGDTNIEGYYVSAIIAGWRASNPLGYVADDMKVPLITSIPSSNSYYSEDDLDALAKSGWYMLNQELDSSPVTCYIQKTTAYDNPAKAEESFIVAIDSAMRDIRATLAPYIKGGLDNRVSGSEPTSPVTMRYLAKLNAALSTVRYKYITNEVFAAMELISIKVSELSKTGVDIEVRFVHYYQVREINVTGYVE